MVVLPGKLLNTCVKLSNQVAPVVSHIIATTTYKLDAESRELRDLESRGPDVASRA